MNEEEWKKEKAYDRMEFEYVLLARIVLETLSMEDFSYRMIVIAVESLLGGSLEGREELIKNIERSVQHGIEDFKNGRRIGSPLSLKNKEKEDE